MSWQPIETAPKDRRILGSIGEGGARVVVEMEFIYSHNEWNRPMGCGVVLNPTHWMPLPEPPK